MTNKKHGWAGTPTYYAWKSMKARCTNPKDRAWTRYGGRGIKVCDRWLSSFENFLADMGERPEGLSLDRIKNNEGYSPDNCRWATPKEQARNRRGNVYIEWKGETKSIAEWCELLNVKMGTLHKRLGCGWSIEEALNPQISEQRKCIERDSNGRFKKRTTICTRYTNRLLT